MTKANIDRLHTLCAMLFMHLCAFGYYMIIDVEVVQKSHPPIYWDSNLGMLLSTPILMMLSYSWLMLLFKSIGWTEWYQSIDHSLDSPVSQVSRVNSDWRPKKVHWIHKPKGME